MLKDCIEKGECNIMFYKLDGCPHCTNMKNKLDKLGIPYLTKDADEEVVEMSGIQTAPQLHIITKRDIRVVTSEKELDDLLL